MQPNSCLAFGMDGENAWNEMTASFSDQSADIAPTNTENELWAAIDVDTDISDIDILLREFTSASDSPSLLLDSLQDTGETPLLKMETGDDDLLSLTSCGRSVAASSSGSGTLSDNDDEMSGSEGLDESLMDLIGGVEQCSYTGCSSSSSTSSLSPLHSSYSNLLSPSSSSSAEATDMSGISSGERAHPNIASQQRRQPPHEKRLTAASSGSLSSSGDGVASSTVTVCRSAVSVTKQPSSSPSPLVVPVSVRGVGASVRAVRVIPAASSSVTVSGRSTVESSALSSSGATRVIRVIKGGASTSASGGARINASRGALPVIKVSRGGTPSFVKIVDQGNNSAGAGVGAYSAADMARLSITAEECRLLEQEGVPVPCHWPLTRQEEHNLKRIRRKIRNKMSAQDSRKRKKEYYDSLEDKVRTFTEENRSLHKRLRQLESRVTMLTSQNETLDAQLRRVRQQQTDSVTCSDGTQQQNVPSTGRKTSAAPPALCLLVLMMSISLCLLPHRDSQRSVTPTSTVANTLFSDLAVAQPQQQWQQPPHPFNKSPVGGSAVLEVAHQLSAYLHKQLLPSAAGFKQLHTKQLQLVTADVEPLSAVKSGFNDRPLSSATFSVRGGAANGGINTLAASSMLLALD